MCEGHQRLTKTTETLATPSRARTIPRRPSRCLQASADAAMPVANPTSQTQMQ